MAKSVMPQSTKELVFVDVEPGGGDPRRHPIIQLAAVTVDGALREVEQFEVKVRFSENAATKASLRKAHYSRARWNREAVEPHRAARSFATFLRSHASVPVMRQDGTFANVAQLVAHNATFDASFLQTWYEKLGIYCPARFQVLCTLQRAEWYFAERPDLPRPDNFKLLTLCRYFRVPLHPFEAHDALADVRATIGLYRAIREAEALPITATQRLRSMPARRASRFAASS